MSRKKRPSRHRKPAARARPKAAAPARGKARRVPAGVPPPEHPAHDPFLLGPREHPTRVAPLPPHPGRGARYEYGVPVPDGRDPWRDEGAEDSGPP